MNIVVKPVKIPASTLIHLYEFPKTTCYIKFDTLNKLQTAVNFINVSYLTELLKITASCRCVFFLLQVMLDSLCHWFITSLATLFCVYNVFENFLQCKLAKMTRFIPIM